MLEPPVTNPPYISGPYSRCDCCRIVVPEGETRCEECLANEVTPEDYENWAAYCDDVKGLVE